MVGLGQVEQEQPSVVWLAREELSQQELAAPMRAAVVASAALAVPVVKPAPVALKLVQTELGPEPGLVLVLESVLASGQRPRQLLVVAPVPVLMRG